MKKQSVIKTPVLFLIFNRLDTTKRVFEAIRQARPRKIYIAADGARTNKQDDETKKVALVRDYVISNIDWNCEVKTLFREKNIGCKYAVSGAIKWFFENEEMGIILEDDCVPNHSFFLFCEELLNRYKNNDEIFLISGDGSSTRKIRIIDDYSFVKYPLIWGWASWSRVWEKYDVLMSDWPANKNKIIETVSKSSATRKFWYNAFQSVYNGNIDTWDYQFTYLMLKNNAKCIVPRLNLISNIGFGEDATHTTKKDHKHANISSGELIFPIKHPIQFTFDNRLNSYYDKFIFAKKSIVLRGVNKLLKAIFHKTDE